MGPASHQNYVFILAALCLKINIFWYLFLIFYKLSNLFHMLLCIMNNSVLFS